MSPHALIDPGKVNPLRRSPLCQRHPLRSSERSFIVPLSITAFLVILTATLLRFGF
jgi:hypothetical protein